MTSEESPRQKLATLSDLQRQILTLHCQGLEYKQIAKKLDYSHHTIKKYMQDIRSLLGIEVATRSKLKATIFTEYCPELEKLHLSVEVEETVTTQSDSSTGAETIVENSTKHRLQFSTLLSLRPLRWLMTGILSMALLRTALFLVITASLIYLIWGDNFKTVRETTNTVNETAMTAATAPDSILIDDFEQDINDWYAARRNTDDWKSNEVALIVHHSTDAAVGQGALQADFDFNLTDEFDPRATYFQVNLPTQDWTAYHTLQFQAKSMIDLSTNIRVFIALATGEDSCWHELGDFQKLGLEYQTFTFDLDRPLYKSCPDFNNYDQALTDKEQVTRLHLIFTAEHKPSGAVLIDDIRLSKK